MEVALDLEHCPFSSTFPLEETTGKKILYISVFTGNATEMFLDTRPQQVFKAFKGFWINEHSENIWAFDFSEFQCVV